MPRLSGVGRLQWSYELSGVVQARPEMVASWWGDSDRAKEFPLFARESGLREISFADSFENEVRVLRLVLMDAKGIEYSHRIEMDLTRNGLFGWNDGIFRMPLRETVSFHSQLGSEMTKTCEALIAIAPIPEDSSAIRAAFEVSLVGGQWLYRRRIKSVDEKSTTALFRDSIDRCQKALDTEGHQTLD